MQNTYKTSLDAIENYIHMPFLLFYLLINSMKSSIHDGEHKLAHWSCMMKKSRPAIGPVI